MCISETEGPNGTGRPFGRWKDRVKYMSERGISRGEWLEKAKDRERWRLFGCDHLLGRAPRGSKIQRL